MCELTKNTYLFLIVLLFIFFIVVVVLNGDVENEIENFSDTDVNVICGTNVNNELFCMNDKDKKWEKVGGNLKQISMEGKTVCGVDKDDNIMCKDTDKLLKNSEWKQIPGKLSQIILKRGKLYGVNNASEIFMSTSIYEPKWEKIPGGLKNISVDNNAFEMMYLNSDTGIPVK